MTFQIMPNFSTTRMVFRDSPFRLDFAVIANIFQPTATFNYNTVTTGRISTTTVYISANINSFHIREPYGFLISCTWNVEHPWNFIYNWPLSKEFASIRDDPVRAEIGLYCAIAFQCLQASIHNVHIDIDDGNFAAFLKYMHNCRTKKEKLFIDDEYTELRTELNLLHRILLLGKIHICTNCYIYSGIEATLNFGGYGGLYAGNLKCVSDYMNF